jgi:hypothetical protein
MIQDECVDDGVRLVDPIVGFREPEPHRVSGERPEQPLVHELLDAPRHRPPLVEGIARAAEEVPRNEVVPTAYAHVHALRVVHGVDGDVAARVPGTDDEHPLSRQLRRVLVGARVHELSGEVPAECRDVRLGEGTVREDDAPVLGGGRPVGSLRVERPAAFRGGLDPRDSCLEAEPVAQ